MGYLNIYRNSNNYGSSHKATHKRRHNSEPNPTRKEVYYYDKKRTKRRKPESRGSSNLMRVEKKYGKDSKAYKYAEFTEGSHHRARRAAQVLSGFN